MAKTRKQIAADWYQRNRSRELERAKQRRSAPEWKVYKDAWYRQNRERVLVSQAEKRAFMRRLIDSAKAFPCADCGVQYPPHVMEFDHVRGEKVRPIADFLRLFNISSFFAEVEKCDVVCANCHAERTHRRGQQFSRVTNVAQRLK